MAQTIDYIVPAIGIAISLHAFISNLHLLFRHRSMASWFIEDRPLLLGILLANSISSLAHLVVFILSICEHMDIVGDDYGWIVGLGDACTAVSTMYIAGVAIRGFIQIRRCLRAGPSGQVQADKWIHVAHIVWPLAILLSLFGINSDNSAFWFTLPRIVSDLSYFISIIILQLIVVGLLFMTRRYAKRLQTDFTINKASQCLKTRVSLSRILKRTQILIPQLAINVILWFCLFSADFLVDLFTAASKGVRYDQLDEEDTSEVWDSCMDCMEVLIFAIYPILLTRKPGTPILRHILKALICQNDLKESSVVAPQIPMVTINPPTTSHRGSIRQAKTSGEHWRAMDSMWSNVENAKAHRKK